MHTILFDIEEKEPLAVVEGGATLVEAVTIFLKNEDWWDEPYVFHPDPENPLTGKQLVEENPSMLAEFFKLVEVPTITVAKG